MQSDGRPGLHEPQAVRRLGRWVQVQRVGWPSLAEDRRDLPAAIVVEADLEPVAP